MFKAKSLQNKNFKNLQLSSNKQIQTSINKPNIITNNNNNNKLCLTSLSPSTPPTDISIDYFTTNINLSDLVQLGPLGSGNSGTVTKVLYVPKSKILAKKTIPIEINNIETLNNLKNELNILKNIKKLKNPYLIDFYGAFLINNNREIIILLQYMNCGSLDKILTTFKFYKKNINSNINYWFDTLALSKISSAVLNGLHFLYENYKIIHRDIKPSNILINSQSQIKLCDFGVSKSLINNSIANTFIGTSMYMSPERIQGKFYSSKSDVWSLGLTLIELITGTFPLRNIENTITGCDGILDLLQIIVNEPSPKLDSQYRNLYPDSLSSFIDRCCVKDENKRASVNELLKHPFVLPSNDENTNIIFSQWCNKIRSYLKEVRAVKREIKQRESYSRKH